MAVIAENTGVYHPAVTRGRDLGARPGRERQALFRASEGVRSPKFANPDAINRKR